MHYLINHVYDQPVPLAFPSDHARSLDDSRNPVSTLPNGSLASSFYEDVRYLSLEIIMYVICFRNWQT